jgi:hypothetical protein
MWIPIGVGTGAIFIVVVVLKWLSRPRSRKIDVGPVSDAWLAEQRARGRDSV